MYQRREYDKILFMGSYPFSFAKCYELSKRLDLIFEILGGIQQPCHCSDNCFCKNEVLAGKEDIEIFCQDVCMALTGKEWKPV